MSRPFGVLFVCTGNLCRSPIAERLLATALAGPVAAGALTVTSAGTRTRAGRPMERAAALVLGEVGVEEAGFVSSRLDEAAVNGADLILVAAREHRSATVSMAPAAMRRTFTLVEFARLLALVDDAPVDGRSPLESCRTLVESVAKQRGRVFLGAEAEDLPDPIGEPVEVFRVSRDDISALLTGPVRALAAALG
jgi:protein-tyrosine phosphatase